MPNSTTTQVPTPTIYTGSSFSALSARSDVYAVSVRNALSPGRSSAVLEADFGHLSTGGPFRLVSPPDLADKCVRIVLDSETIFEGIVQDQEMHPVGTFSNRAHTRPTGVARYRCTGMDALLDEVHIDRSVTAAYGDVDEPFAFNGRDGTDGNASASESSSSSGTSRLFDWTASAQKWTCLDIVKYALRFAQARTSFSWQVGGPADSYLDYIVRPIDPAGMTVRQLLNAAIRSSEGFAWRVDVSGGTCTVLVQSLTDTAVTDIGGTTVVPAHGTTVSLSSAVETSRLVDAPVITRVAESAYSQIEVYSEPIRIVATLDVVSTGMTDGLVPDWTAAEQTAFDADDDDSRKGEEYRHVYTQFRLPADWDGTDFQGENVLPQYDPETLTISLLATGSLATPAVVFERSIPTADGADERPALLQLYDDDNFTFVIADKPDDPLPAIGLDILDDGPAVRMGPPKTPVTLAKDRFTGTSEVSEDWDTDGALLTLSFYAHTRLSARVSGSGSRKKAIYAPGFHLWLCPNTDARTDVGQSYGTQLIRDDRTELGRLAKMAGVWYGRERNTLQLSAAVMPSIGPSLGSVVTSAYSGGTYTPIGTPITSEEYRWDSAGHFRYQMSTDFADLDFQRLARRVAESRERVVDRRLRRIEDRLRFTPLRVTGAGGGGDLCWVKITGVHTDSPTGGSDVRFFSGNRHSVPVSGAGTTAGVTIYIVDYPAGQENYPSGYLPALPIRYTWTGDSDTHTETVYFAWTVGWMGISS